MGITMSIKCYICNYGLDPAQFNFGSYNDYSGKDHVNLTFCHEHSRAVLGAINRLKRELSQGAKQ